MVNFLIHSDGAETNDPQLRDIDYARKLLNIQTGNPLTRRFTIPPQSIVKVMQTARTLTQDLTTGYTVTLKAGSTYRYAHSAGTSPGLRTQRTIAYDALTEFDVTKVGDVVRYMWNGTGADPNFALNGVVVGDVFHIEAGGNFNPLNEGSFTVVTVVDDYVEVLNANGVPENAIAAGPNISSAIPIDYFSAAGVQVADQVKITDSAFNIENRGIFTVTAVTSTYFEISNGNPGIPEGPVVLANTGGIVFYPEIFMWTYIEADQKVSVRLNGDTSDNVEMEPVIAGDQQQVAVFLHRGGVFQLELANNGINSADVKIVLAE